MIRINRGMLIVLILIGIGIGGTFLSSQFSRWKSSPEDADHAVHKNIYYCPMHPTYTSDKPGDCPICNMKLVKRDKEAKAFLDTTPREMTVEEIMKMKPGEICLLHKCKMGKCMIAMTPEMAKLGKCPHCGEDLGVIIKEAAPHGYADVQLSPDKQKLIGIKTAPVIEQEMTKTIRTVGRIAYDPELYQAEEEFIQAFQAHQKAEQGNIPEIKEQAAQLVDSAKLKLKLMGLSDELIEELQSAGKPDRSLLYSEKGGSVWLYAPIYEYEIPLVNVGDKVEAEIPAISGRKFEGIIRSMDPVLDPNTRSVRVRAVLENPEGSLKPEMYVNVTLNIDIGKVLAVPEAAVFSTGERNVVFIEKMPGIFEPREITLGVKVKNYYEVKSGLAEGQKVVTSGNFLIDSESRLKAALEGMDSEAGSGSGVHQHGG